MPSDSIFYNDSEFFTNLTYVGMCNMPRPQVNGATPSGEIHPDVIPHPKVAGKYLMVWTPYPSLPVQEATECPVIADSSDKLNWTLLPNADVPLIVPWGGSRWIPDPDLLYIDDLDRYYLYNNTQDGYCKIHTTNDGNPLHFPNRYYGYVPSWGSMSRSPSVLRDKVNSHYVMYYDGPQTGTGKYSIGRCILPDGLSYDGSTDLAPVVQIADGAGKGHVWHPSVRFFDGAYYMVAPGSRVGIVGSADIYAWKSLDGESWTSVGIVIPLTSLPVSDGKVPSSGYRCSMLFENNMLYVFVSYNVGSDANWSCRIALYTTELSTAGKAALNYVPTDYEQGGKIKTSGTRQALGTVWPPPYSGVTTTTGAGTTTTVAPTTTAAPTTTTGAPTTSTTTTTASDTTSTTTVAPTTTATPTTTTTTAPPLPTPQFYSTSLWPATNSSIYPAISSYSSATESFTIEYGDYYQIMFSDTYSNSVTIPNGQTLAVTGLNPGTLYGFRIRANGSGSYSNSAWTTEFDKATTGVATTTAAPTTSTTTTTHAATTTTTPTGTTSTTAAPTTTTVAPTTTTPAATTTTAPEPVFSLRLIPAAFGPVRYRVGRQTVQFEFDDTGTGPVRIMTSNGVKVFK